MCHPTNHDKYDLPKGELDPEESYLMCAIRETFEETGLLFEKNNLIDLGRFEFIEKKDLYLFKTYVEKSTIEIKDLKCISYFEDEKTQQIIIEVDGFDWIKLDELPLKVPQSMYRVLSKIIDGENK